jgi:hypothetical protein
MAKKPKLGTGKRAAAIKAKVAAAYKKKGKSKEEAERIGGAVAGQAGRAAHGKKKMAKWSAAGRKRAKK